MHRGVQSGLPRPLPRKGEEARMEERPQFRVEYLTPSAEVGVVVLEGEIDIYSAPQFKEVLLNGIEGGARRVIVDLSDVTFIDSTALGVLVSGAKRVRPRNGNLDIVCTDENIIRIFEITGLDRIFGIYATRVEAVKAAGP
jgi:anti-sigma B factor antagonist